MKYFFERRVGLHQKMPIKKKTTKSEANSPVKEHPIKQPRPASVADTGLKSKLSTLLRMATGTEQRAPDTGFKPQITFVCQWIDFSSKYGLGYQLTNGAIGLHFNDNSKIISTSSGDKVEYRFKNSDKEMTVIYNLDSFPNEMKKKITLYKHFKKCFTRNQKIQNSLDI